MKAKKLLTIALAAVLAMGAAVSVSAAELTNREEEREGKTKVKAHIDGEDPGNVTYVITIPDELDFGALTKPTTDEDSFDDVDFSVEATKIEGLDPETQQIGVYVRDEKATLNDDGFRIANDVATNIEFYYDVYNVPQINIGTRNINAEAMTLPIGYSCFAFTQQRQVESGVLRLNLHQLDAYNSLSEIVGTYSGYMVFYSQVEDK